MANDDSHHDERWKNIPLSDIDLSVRTSNCLYRMGLTTLGELACLTDADLLGQPNFGKKCLDEVKAILSSTEDLTVGKERASNDHEPDVDALDFLTIEEPLSSTLLRPVQTLKLTTRASNVMEEQEITTVGELAQLTESELLRTPKVGGLTIDNLKSVLADFDLSLGTTITNWPDKDELASLLESRAQDRLDRTHTSIETFTLLEDELCAAVKAAVGINEYAIVIRRTGWDGDRVWTLEELANDPVVSGRAAPVSRERIRQIESAAYRKIRNMGLSTPILDRAIGLIQEKVPLAIETLPSLLQEHGITQCGLGYKATSAAMKMFDMNWDIVYRTIGQDSFLLPSHQADEIEASWNILIGAAVDRDFVKLDSLNNSSRQTIPLSSDIVEASMSTIPSLCWLDRDHRIYWSLERVRRGWNKTINVCLKILTIAPEVPIKRLTVAVKRARTVKNFPAETTFVNMLLSLDEFDVDGGIVSRGKSFKPQILSKNDWLMINAAADVGTVTSFLELRQALVRRGLSANHAQVLMVVSPFWITTARGKYRFIAKQAQLKEVRLNEPETMDETEEHQECLVELKVTHRHLVIGSHRVEENLVKRGQWSLRDEKGNDLGKLNVAGSMIKGLNLAFSVAEIEVDTFVIIDFSDADFSATLLY